MIPEKEYLASLPRKITGAGVLFFNEAGQVLIVKPNYKETWEIPGGTVDANETIRDAAIREVKEELGLDFDLNLQLACVDNVIDAKSDRLLFVFNGGVLSEDQIKQIKIQDSELDEFVFLNVEDTLERFKNLLGPRLQHAVNVISGKETNIYMEQKLLP